MSPNPFESEVPSFEPDLGSELVQGPERVGHPVVFLDERRRQLPLARHDAEQRVELEILVREAQWALP